MYKEYLIEEVTKDEIPEKRKQDLLGEFYSTNLSLIGKIAHEQSLSMNDYYDYMQLGYTALVDSIKVYDPKSKFSFLSYFRRTFKHKIYLFNLEFQYPLRIKSYTGIKDFNITFSSYGVSPEYLQSDNDAFCNVDSQYYTIENKIMTDTILSILKDELDNFQLTVFIKIFWDRMSKNEIATMYNVPYKEVRRAYDTGIRKLRHNNALRHIAIDMFGLKI